MSAPANRASASALQLRGDDVRHLVAGRDQAIDLAVPERAFADREDVRIGGAAGIVDHDAAAIADRKTRGARQLIARTNAGGEHDQVGLEFTAVGESQAMRALACRRRLRSSVSPYGPPRPSRDAPAQHAAAGVVDLHRHESRCEFDHMRLEPEVLERLRRLETEQSAADDHAALGMWRSRCEWRPDHRWCGRRSSPVDRCPGIGGTNGYEPVASTKRSYSSRRPLGCVHHAPLAIDRDRPFGQLAG